VDQNYRDRPKVRIYCDTDMRDTPLGPEGDKKVDFVKQAGFKVAKIALDEARDPNRYDRFNRTANNAGIDRMISWIRHIREKLPPSVELAVDMHAFYDTATGKHVAQVAESSKGNLGSQAFFSQPH
jgi:galactonate dehydratase